MKCPAFRNKHGAGQTQPICGPEAVKGPQFAVTTRLSLCETLVSFSTTLLDFYIELHLQRVKFKCQFAWLGPSVLVPLELAGCVTECVSGLSTDLHPSHLCSQHFPRTKGPSPPRAVHLLRLRGSCQLLLGAQYPAWGKRGHLLSRKGACPQE